MLIKQTNRFINVAKYGGKNVCLDLYASSANNGAPLICYPCHGGKNQAWKLPGITQKRLNSFGIN
jgi:hypothetical protein